MCYHELVRCEKVPFGEGVVHGAHHQGAEDVTGPGSEGGILREVRYVRPELKLGWPCKELLVVPIEADLGRRCQQRLYVDMADRGFRVEVQPTGLRQGLVLQQHVLVRVQVGRDVALSPARTAQHLQRLEHI